MSIDEAEEALNRIRTFRERIQLKPAQRAVATLISARVVAACREGMLAGFLSCETEEDALSAVSAGLAMGVKSFQEAQAAGERANKSSGTAQ